MTNRILIIDDDQQVIETTETILKEFGFITHSVCDGLAAFKTVKELKPSLILVDGNLSSISGLEILQQIRADNETAAIPVILVTGSEEIPNKELFNDFLIKPYDLDMLVEKIRNLLK